MKKNLLVALIALFACAGIPLCAQQENAQLSGIILDQSGAAVVDASIIIADPGRGLSRATTSNQSGEYTFALLPPGSHYILTITKPGFKTNVHQNLTLQVAQSATLNITLAAGGEATTVTVNAEAPLLETESSSQGQVITSESVTGLPLNGRSTFRLIQLTPGVVFSNGAYGQFGDVAVNTTFDSNFRINGGRASSNEFLIDGVPTVTGFYDQITTDPMPDETEEFKVESTDLPAEYGRFAGGVINVSTKSGTNEVHGDAFDFLRNSVFDANDWFSNHNGKPIPVFRMNQFGGVIGGPVVLRKLYNGRNKTFFFGSFQGTRRAKGSPYIATVPTDAEKSGDFSASGVPIYNPFSYNSSTGNRTQYSGNKILSGFDPVALAIQKYFPEPNVDGAGLTNNFYHASPITVNQDTYSARIDRNVTSAYKLFGRYSISTTGLTQPNQTGTIADAAGSVGTTYFRNQSFSLGNTFILSPKTLLSVSYGFARWHQIRTTLSYGFDNSTLGFPASYVGSLSIPMFPTVTIVGFMGTNGQTYFNNGNDSHAIIVQLSRVSGRNSLTVGADGRMHRINFFNSNGPSGQYAFAQQQTRLNNVVTTGGNAYASFLLGFGNSGFITDAAGSELQDFYGAVYAQDNFRLSPKLTLNAGVRYDGETAYLDRHNELNYFDPNVASPARNPEFPQLTGGLVFAETNGVGRAVYTRDHLNIAPRVGFAWAPASDISVRGAYGIVFAPLELTTNGVGTVPNLGFGSMTNWETGQAVGTSGQVPVNLLSNPYPSGFVPSTGSSLGAGTQLGQGLNGNNTSMWEHHPATPYSEQWSFDIQQQFRDNSLLDMSYVGSIGVHLTSPRELDYLPAADLSIYGSGLNTLEPNPFAPFVSVGALSEPNVAQRQLLLPYPQFTSVMEVNSTFGVATYNGLSVKYVKRAGHSLNLLVSYTWSKEMSNVNAQDAPIGNTNQSTTPQDWGNLQAERSISDMDMPQNLVVSGTAQLPFGTGKKFLNHGGLENKFVGGWSFDPIWIEQSGFPLEMTVATSWGATRPNRVPGASLKIPGKRNNAQRVAEWFNTAAFTTPPAYTYGTERRTTSDVRKPGISNVDASLVKATPFGDRLSSQFRMDVFNVANSAHFAPPGMTVTTPQTYGVISSVLTAPSEREIQFSLKLLF